MNKNNTNVSMKLKASVYKQLALLMRYPDELFQNSFNAHIDKLTDSLTQVLDHQPDNLLSSINDININESEILQMLQVQYTRLFITGVPNVVAYPCASAWDGEGLLMGQLSDDVTDYYQMCGLEITTEDMQPDHICLELEFMSYLFDMDVYMSNNGKKELTASVDYKKLREDFLTDHLHPWVSKWSQAIEIEESEFYYALTTIIRVMIESDLKGMNDLNEKSKEGLELCLNPC